MIADVTDGISRDDVTFNAFKNVIKVRRRRACHSRARRGGAAALVLRQAERLGAGRGRAGAWLCHVRRGGRRRSSARAPIANVSIAAPERTAPIAREARPEGRRRRVLRLRPGDKAAKLAGAGAHSIGTELGLVDKDRFEFCWIVDFPMYEWNEDEKKIDFSHNPFSMPQGGLEALRDERTRSTSGLPI